MIETLHIRWSVRADLGRVVGIAGCFRPAPDERFFRDLCNLRNHILLVAEDGEVVVGYAAYELRPRSTRILQLAVDPQHRRRGVGRALLERIAIRLTDRRRTAVFVVPETGLVAQKFLAACGYRATRVLRGCFSEPAEDGYRFVYRNDSATVDTVTDFTITEK